MSLSSYYDSSFGGTGFLELFEEWGVEADTVEDVTLIHIPGGDTTVVQSSGRTAQTLDLPIGVQAAELTALRGKVGTSGSLVYHAGTRTARLTGVKNPRKSAGHDAYKATLNLVLL